MLLYQVDQGMFTVTQSPSAINRLSQEIDEIKQNFSIAWQTVTWQDLTKPLYSALAARLYLQFKNPNTVIPRSIDLQATFWKTNYRVSGNISYFITSAQLSPQGRLFTVNSFSYLFNSIHSFCQQFRKELE